MGCICGLVKFCDTRLLDVSFWCNHNRLWDVCLELCPTTIQTPLEPAHTIPPCYAELFLVCSVVASSEPWPSSLHKDHSLGSKQGTRGRTKCPFEHCRHPVGLFGQHLQGTSHSVIGSAAPERDRETLLVSENLLQSLAQFRLSLVLLKQKYLVAECTLGHQMSYHTTTTSAINVPVTSSHHLLGETVKHSRSPA